MRLVLSLGFLVFVTLFAGVASFPALAQQTTNITIGYDTGLDQLCVSARNCFDPPVLRIMVGTTVEWKNNDGFSHTVTNGSPYYSQVGDKFDSGLITPGKTFAFTFKNVGEYHYFCEIHPWMKGEIDVIR